MDRTLCLVFALLVHVVTGASLNEYRNKPVLPNKYAYLQPEIDEWIRLGNPTKLQFNGGDDDVANIVDLNDDSPLHLLGSTNYEKDISFYLFNSENPNGTVVSKSVDEVNAAGWKVDTPTKIIIHGFNANINGGVFSAVVPSLLKKGEYNIIGVDWGKLCRAPDYIGARSHVKGVGGVVADMIDFLVEEGLLLTKDIHIMGHSLGAHVAGNTGKLVSTGDVQRITGMDPAGPLFLLIKNDRLSKGDAVTVDVIHTCAGLVGLDNELGDIDFWPNGGKHPQPGCNLGIDLINGITCSHLRSFELMGESVLERNSFQSELCDSKEDAKKGQCQGSNGVTANMGDDLEYMKPGSYYLETASSNPFDLEAHRAAQLGQ